MKFSLVLATVDRSDELERFMLHLNQQICRDFELIVVDQNHDDRVALILTPYFELFPILHIKSNELGASKARNLGVKYVSGEIIGFPDDDCWYAPDLLIKVIELFSIYPEWDGLTGRAIGIEGKTVGLHFDHRAGIVARYNAWRRVTTFTMFLRSNRIKGFEGFDEQLGVGAASPWGAGEDTDYLIRLVDGGCRVYYDPGLNVYHPDPLQYQPEKLLRRGYSYGCGMGKVLRKNQYPLWFFLYYLMRSVGGVILALAKADLSQAGHYRETFRGRLYGWRKGH
jgi:glycosyltransferase involved in cell wall biosynthesis